MLVALCSWALLAAVTWRTPIGLHFYDPVIQLLAVQQAQRGDSPGWNVLRRVDPADLSQDILEPVGWWAPAIPALTGPLTGAGMPLGLALRIVVISAGAAGALGWALWLTRFALPYPWLFALAALLPWLRPSSAGFFRFSADSLAFAAAPWVFLGLLGLCRRLQKENATLIFLGWTGLALGLAGAVKYSLATATVASFSAVAWIVCRHKAPTRLTFARLTVLGLAILAVPAVIKLCHALRGATDPTGHTAADNHSLSTALFALSNPVLGLADAASPAYRVFTTFPGISELSIAQNLVWAGLPGAALLIWLVVKSRPLDELRPAEALPLLTLLIFTLLMIVLWLSTDATRDSRLFSPVTCAALPAVIVLGLRIRSHAKHGTRALLFLGAIVYLIIPLAYGPLFVAAKVIGTRHVTPIASQIQLPSLGVDHQHALIMELASYAAKDALWLVTDPEIALALPGRILTPRSGRSIADDLSAIYVAPANLAHWRTRATLKLRVLADPGPVPPPLPSSIPRTTHWTPHYVAAGQKVLWTALLDPNDGPSPSLPSRSRRP